MRKVLETLKSKNCILRATIHASNFQQKSLKIGEEQLHHLKTLNPSCSLLDLFPYTESCFISLPLTHSILNLLQLKLTHIQCDQTCPIFAQIFPYVPTAVFAGKFTFLKIAKKLKVSKNFGQRL